MTAERNTYGLLYVYDLGGYSTQAIKEWIDYELKSADNPYVGAFIYDVRFLGR